MHFVNLEPFAEHLMAGHTLLTPGLRLARQISNAWISEHLAQSTHSEDKNKYGRGVFSKVVLNAQSKGELEVIQPPGVYTVDAWLEAQWRQRVECGQLPVCRLLNRLEERLLWQAVIEQDSDFNEGFKLLLPAAAAEQAMASRQMLLQYADNPDELLSTQEFIFDLDCAAFVRWYRVFESRLIAGQWLTRADAYRQLLNLHQSVKEKPNVTLCFVDALPPLTQRVLRQLAIIHVLPSGLATSKKTRIITEAEKTLTATARDCSAEFKLPAMCFLDRSHELSAAAAWAAERYKHRIGSTAVVLLNMSNDRSEFEYFLREQFDCLDANYNLLPANFSAGMPLADTPIYRDLLLALRIGMDPVSREDVLALFRSPYLFPKGFAESVPVLRLLKALMDLAIDPIDCADLAHLVQMYLSGSSVSQTDDTTVEQSTSLLAETSGSISVPTNNPDRLRTLFSSGIDARQTRFLNEWVEVIRERLVQWSWPARNTLDSMEFQQLTQLEQTFDTLIALSEIVGRVTYLHAVSVWRTVLNDKVFQPKTEQGAIQVLGPLEITGLSFDSVWVCGAQAGRLPARSQLLPFVPAAVQRSLNYPPASPELLLLETRQKVYQWLENNNTVLASYHQSVDGVDQLPSQLLDPIEICEVVENVCYSRWHDPAIFESLDDSLASVSGELIAFGGGASVLKNQAACPFRAWLVHHLDPESATPTGFGLTAIERGRIVHAALERLWRELKSQSQLLATDQVDLRRLVRGAVLAGVREIAQSLLAREQNLRKRVGPVCLDLEIEHLIGLVMDWLALEAKRSEDFEVVEMENSHDLTVGPLTFRLRPDRVDRLIGGRKLVIDYKTGNARSSDWFGERLGDPQLPIYTLLDTAVEGIAFAKLKRDPGGELKFISLGERLGLNTGRRVKDDLATQVKGLGATVADWSVLREVWRGRLECLAREYAEGVAVIDPQPGACRYCDFASVCRISTEVIALNGDLCTERES